MKTEIQRTQADWAAALPHLQHKGGELVGPCPRCHEGTDRFYVRADGGAFCRQCCPDGSNPDAFKEILRAAGFEAGNGTGAAADQFERDTGKAVTRLSTNGTGRKTVEGGRWPLLDEHGTLLYVHVRYDRPDGTKDRMPWFEADGITPASGVKVRDLPLYGIHRAADLPDATPCRVVIVEGEKKADALRLALADSDRPSLVLGTVTSSSTTPSAAALAAVVKAHRWAGTRRLRPSEREPIYLWPDHDPDEKFVGLKHMQNVGAALLAAAGAAGGDEPIKPAAVRMISWADAPRNGGDAFNWVEAGCSPALQELMQNASTFKAKTKTRSTKAKGKTTDPAPLEVTALRIAERLLSKHGDRLLVLTDSDDSVSDLRVLDDVGIWRGGVNVLRRWLGELAGAMKAEAVEVGLSGKELTAVLAKIDRMHEPHRIMDVKLQAAPALRNLQSRGEAGAVTECLVDDLDTDMRYLGTASGIVDLHTGELLLQAEGRKMLMTRQAPVAFDPAAHHPAVDRLFAHLDPEAIGWWWRVLGFHLLGAPSRRFYVAVGPHSGGKTTLANAIAGTLGPYASRPADDALEARGGSAGAATPELEAFTAPRRWAIIDEAPRMRIAAPLLKRLSGDASQTFRRLHEQLRTMPATATVLVICNPGSIPKLDLQDEAMADRLRELPYPAVTTPDPSMKEIIETDDFRRAFLARLVAAAAAETPRVPPDDVPVVRAATAERVREDVGELGEFARRIVKEGSGLLTFKAVWAAWCALHEELTVVPEVGGIHNKRLSGALRKHVPGLPAARQYSIEGKNTRSWRGWRLLDAVPEEPTMPVEVEPVVKENEVDVPDLGDLSEYAKLVTAWEKKVEPTAAFSVAIEAVERDLRDAPANAPCTLLVTPENRDIFVRRLAFARLLEKVLRDGRPEDQALNLWLDAERPADVPRPVPGAYGSGTTIGDTVPKRR